MLATLKGCLPLLWPFRYNVKVANLDAHIDHAGAESWHGYAIRHRSRRPHVCLACDWLASALPPDALIFEPGCGSGINLHWLGQHGFTRLEGADISPAALDLCGFLADELGHPVKTWRDDSLKPKHTPDGIGGLLSVNWLYHLPDVSLDAFFETYRPFMASGGKIAFDMADKSYNKVKGNEYHSDDLTLPKSLRRPSEYKLRLSPDEVRAAIARHGLKTLRHAKVWGAVPRTVWLAEAPGRAAPES